MEFKACSGSGATEKYLRIGRNRMEFKVSLFDTAAQAELSIGRNRMEFKDIKMGMEQWKRGTV